MANSAAFCTSAKEDLLNGIHAFGTTNTRAGTGADTFNIALFLATGSLGASTTAYSTTSELAGTGNYTQGGKAVTNGTAPTVSSTRMCWENSGN